MADADRDQQIAKAILDGVGVNEITRRFKVGKHRVLAIKRDMLGTGADSSTAAPAPVPVRLPRSWALAERVADLIDANLRTATKIADNLADDAWVLRMAQKDAGLLRLLVDAHGQLSGRALEFLSVVRPGDGDDDRDDGAG